MKTIYYPEDDMLYISLADAKGVGAEEVHEGFVFDFDAQNRVVSIEVEDASKRVDLRAIKADPALVHDHKDDGPGEIFTVAMLAEELKTTPRALQLVIKNMRAAGLEVGISQGSTTTTILSAEDVSRIQVWREEHPRGRPAKQEV